MDKKKFKKLSFFDLMDDLIDSDKLLEMTDDELEDYFQKWEADLKNKEQ